MNERDRVRDDIAKLVWLDGGDNDHGWKTTHCFVHKDGLPYAIADQILSLPEIAVLAEDQTLPSKKGLPLMIGGSTKQVTVTIPTWWDFEALVSYLGQANQEAMIEAGWRKVV